MPGLPTQGPGAWGWNRAHNALPFPKASSKEKEQGTVAHRRDGPASRGRALTANVRQLKIDRSSASEAQDRAIAASFGRMTELPLAGVRVLDLTHALAGSFCTHNLQLLGAEVTQVEPPGTANDSR